ncbi:hypothetical protein ACSV5M_01135 [Cellvibrio sp. ARAG 10.3]|uniref:hypothetical protein n=1 Tax=Cellvibrio sp. ARAG 10.3 TaxID=3451358 RepID=UPI003F44DE3D
MSELIEALLFTTVTTMFLQRRDSTAPWRQKSTHGALYLAAANRNVKKMYHVIAGIPH